MKREIMSVLLGISILTPAAVDAQRVRPRTGRGNGQHVERTNDRVQQPGQPAPIHASGRIALPVRAAAPHAWRQPDRVVYSTRGGFHGRARSASYRAMAFRGPNARFSFRTNHVWIRADWGRMRMVPLRHRRGFEVLYAPELSDMLGRRTVERLFAAGRRAGLYGVMRGNWVAEPGQGLILVVSIGNVDLAEFVDFNRDGFVDDMFMIRDGMGLRVSTRW